MKIYFLTKLSADFIMCLFYCSVDLHLHPQQQCYSGNHLEANL